MDSQVRNCAPQLALRAPRNDSGAFGPIPLPELPAHPGRYGPGPSDRVNFAGEMFASASHFPLKCPITRADA
jgi:hypothetical protein